MNPPGKPTTTLATININYRASRYLKLPGKTSGILLSKSIMKKTVFIIVFLAACFSIKAQIESKDVANKKAVKIQLQPELAEKTLTDIFSGITIIDARDDTSEIGYYSNGMGGRGWPKLYRILPSTGDGINDWITHYLAINTKTSSAPKSLLIVIRKLWLSNEAVPATDENDKKLQAKLLGYDPGIVTNLEFYLEKDSFFYPMYKVDSIFSYTETLPEHAGYYVSESLKESLKKLFNINFSAVLSRGRKLSLNEIVSHIAEDTDIEILKTNNYKKGVYKSFAEFKANAPSIAEYELKTTSLGDMLYVKENGEEYSLRTAWGYCDGSKLFINSTDKYSELTRRQNSFYFAGIKGLNKTTTHGLLPSTFLNFVTQTSEKHTKVSKIIKYYKVDLETGDAY